MIKKMMMLAAVVCMLTACSDDDKDPGDGKYGVKMDIPSDPPSAEVYENRIAGKAWTLVEKNYLTTDFVTVNHETWTGNSVVMYYFPSKDKLVSANMPEGVADHYTVEYEPAEGNITVTSADADGNIRKGTLFRIVQYKDGSLWTLHHFVDANGELSGYMCNRFEEAGDQDWDWI